MKNETFPPVPLTPKEYWDDKDWAHLNIGEISNEYPNLWVAIVNKQVVAAGRIIKQVRKIAKEKTGREHFPVLFAEKGIHVYKN